MAVSQVSEQEQRLHLASITWDGLTWVNIEGPTEREIQYLAQNYPFHPLDLDDCLSRTQRPKIDEYKDYLFVIFHFQIYDKKRRVSSHTQLSVFIGENYLITIHTGQLKALVQLFQECQTDEEVRAENFSNGSGYLLYRILDGLTDSYFPILDKILSLMEEVEDKVFDENIEAAQELSLLRRDIITQRRIVFPLRSVMVSLESKIKRFSKRDMSVYWGDMIDHMNNICETLDEIKEVMEVYKDSDYVLSTERLNRIMRVLTIMSTIMLPLIVISGLWSMNVPLPFGGNPGGSPYFFAVMVVALLSIVAAMLLFFHRRRWI